MNCLDKNGDDDGDIVVIIIIIVGVEVEVEVAVFIQKICDGARDFKRLSSIK